MTFIQGVAKVKDGGRLLAKVVDNKAFSKLCPDWHSIDGYTVELESGPVSLATLPEVKAFLLNAGIGLR